MLRRLSSRAELILITLLCFGPFAAISLSGVIRRQTELVYDDRRIYMIIGIELVAGAIAIAILKVRGWTPSDLGMKPTMLLTIAGMALFIGANIAIATFYEVFRAVSGTDPAAATTPVIRTSWLAVFLLLLIDPLYEETLVAAYVVRATEASGALFAISLSAGIRLLCHLYQGPITALTILPLGLIFAAVYWKWRRVWPLVVAHGVAGFFGLAPQG